MTGPKIKPQMPNKAAAQQHGGEYAKAIVRLLTIARDTDLILFDRMDSEVVRILGVRYQLPELGT